MSAGRGRALARRAATAAAAGAAVQVLPAATWLAPVRARLTPALDSPMPRGSLALTFDDGPHPEGTPAILDLLDVHRWPATFFILGSAARRYPELVQEIRRRGHTVGVHGHDHRYLIARLPATQVADLRRAIDVAATLAGQPVRWWRPPYGVLSGPSLLAARRFGVRPLLWSAWGRDWTTDATGESIVACARRGRLDGGTLLLHDSDVTSAPGSWRRTADALPVLADRLDRAGIVVRPLPEAA